MVNIQTLGLHPTQNLHEIPSEKFVALFLELWETICMYKGKTFREDEAEKSVRFLQTITAGKIKNMTVNDATAAIETAMYSDEIKTLSVEFFNSTLKKQSLKKLQDSENRTQTEWTKKNEIDNSIFAKAMRLRITHDPGGKILDANNHTLKNVFEAAQNGVNYYTGHKL